MGRNGSLDPGQFRVFGNEVSYGLGRKLLRILRQEDVFIFDVILLHHALVIMKRLQGFGVGYKYITFFVSFPHDPEGILAGVIIGIFQVTKLVNAKASGEQDLQDSDIPPIQEVRRGLFVVIRSF